MGWKLDVENGDWIETSGGIGQLVSSHKFYVEEYQVQVPDGAGFAPAKRPVGSEDLAIAVYKLFCNYEGVPRKRFALGRENMEYISPLSEKYKATLENAIKQSPESLQRFKDFRSKKRIGDWKKFWIQVPVCEFEQYEILVKSIFAEIGTPFVFSEVLKLLDSHNIGLNYRLNAPDQGFISVGMFNEGLATQGKRRVFTQTYVHINSAGA